MQEGETRILHFSWPSAEAVCLPISPFDKGGTNMNKGEKTWSEPALRKTQERKVISCDRDCFPGIHCTVE